MKFLALVFLFGLATASLHDILDDCDELDSILRSEKKEKDDLQTELGKKLKKTLDDMLKQIKQAVEDGKGVQQKLLDKAKDLVRKLKEYGVDVSDEAKEILNYLKSRIENWVKELIDILKDDSTTVHRADNRVKEIGNELRERLRKVLEKIKKAMEDGERVSQNLWDEANELAARLKKYGVDVGEEIRDMIVYLKHRISEWAKEIMDILREKHEKRYIFERELLIIERFGLRKHFEELKKLVTGDGNAEAYIEKHFEKFPTIKCILARALDKGKEVLLNIIEMVLQSADLY